VLSNRRNRKLRWALEKCSRCTCFRPIRASHYGCVSARLQSGMLAKAAWVQGESYSDVIQTRWCTDSEAVEGQAIVLA
jgi:hypothetical protein